MSKLEMIENTLRDMFRDCRVDYDNIYIDNYQATTALIVTSGYFNAKTLRNLITVCDFYGVSFSIDCPNGFIITD